MKRLFFGLKPNAPALRHCMGILKAIKSDTIRPIPVANLHLTLVFLGAIEPATERALMESASTIHIPNLSIVFDQLSHWAKPQILSLTSNQPNPELHTLATRLKLIANGVDITLDKRPYVPHITLAKKVKHRITAAFEPFTWQSDEFCLFESITTANGVVYRVLKSWPASS